MGGGGSKQKPQTLTEAKAQVRRLSVELGSTEDNAVRHVMSTTSQKQLDTGRLRTNSETRNREEVKATLQSGKTKALDDSSVETPKKRGFVFHVKSNEVVSSVPTNLMEL
jgi:hypothetical protein